MRDPFVVMGLPPTATPDEIKARYRELARQHHPDAGPAGSSARMAEINRAHDELTRDLAGCRRRASASRQRSRPAGPARSGQPRAASRSRVQNRTAQWKEWLERARRAARNTPSEGHTRRTAEPGSQEAYRVKVSPPILTLCRHHGFHDLKVAGEGAEHSTVLFSPARFEVVRGPFDQRSQIFRVRLKDQLPESEGDAYLRVRRAGATRKVPVYEFSCPSPGGSCAFAS